MVLEPGHAAARIGNRRVASKNSDGCGEGGGQEPEPEAVARGSGVGSMGRIGERKTTHGLYEML